MRVSHYGITLHNRIGLSRLSFAMTDSYERLEKNLIPLSLFGRICDRKTRIAELNQFLGIPAVFGEIEADRALQNILPPASQAFAGRWEYAVGKINRLDGPSVPGWMPKPAAARPLSTEIKIPRSSSL